MDNPRGKSTREHKTVNVSPAAVDMLAVQLDEFERLAENLTLEAVRVCKVVRQLREQFESIKELSKIMLGGNHD